MDDNTKATTLEELLKSKEYKDSKHELFELDGEYALKDKKTNEFLSINNSGTRWNSDGSKYDIIRYCITSKEKIIEVFYREVDPFITKKENKLKAGQLKSLDLKEVQKLNDKSYKAKLMEGLE